MDRTKFLMKHFGLTKRPNPTYKQYFTFGELQKLLIDYEKAINYSQCCESDSELLQKIEMIKSFKWGIDPTDNERRMCELINLL